MASFRAKEIGKIGSHRTFISPQQTSPRRTAYLDMDGRGIRTDFLGLGLMLAPPFRH